MHHGIAAHGDPVADDGRVGVGGDVDGGAVAEPEAFTDGHHLAVGTNHAVVPEPGLRPEGGGADHRTAASAPDRTGGEDREDPVMGQDQVGGHADGLLRSPVARTGTRGI